jgi:hypothetical protein
MIVSEVKQRVRGILETSKFARDCDRQLIAFMWEQDIKDFGDNPKKISAEEMLVLLVDGELTSPESIRRCRQKLQEENESLRGVKYNDRQRKGEEVRKSISK